MEVLRARGSLDDGQLAERLDRNRHYVNQVFRELRDRYGRLLACAREDLPCSSRSSHRRIWGFTMHRRHIPRLKVSSGE